MSRIEQLIGEIEEYIDSCKFQPLSNTKILVNKEEMEELLVELRLRVPDEIKKYQKIISQQEAILADAKSQAEEMLAQAKNQTSEMVSQHEVTQQVEAQAQAMLMQAQQQADTIVNNAVNDANSMRLAAVKYTDDILASLQGIISHSIESARGRFDGYMSALESAYQTVASNREQLRPQEQPQESAPQQEAEEAEQPQEQ